MKDKLSISVNCIASFLLSLCVPWCLTSSFDINVNSGTVLCSVAVFTGVFSALSVFTKNKKQFWISISVIAMVFVVMTALAMNTIISQVNYIVNCVLKLYSNSFPVPNYVDFSSFIDSNADAAFAMLGFLLSAVNTFSLVRAKRLIPCAVFCVICLVPCFVLVTNPPAIVPIVTVITILISLYITAFFRKVSFQIHGSVFMVVACVVLILSVVTYSFIPVENYKRFEWQDNLLEATEQLFKSGDNENSEFEAILDSIDKTKNLADIGPLEQKGIKTLEVNAKNGGNIYLKDIAYANYSDNEWSVLTDEQAESFPENFDAYNITKGAEIHNIDIITENKHDILYTPYNPIDVSVGFTPVYDMFLANNNGDKSYNFECYTDFYSYKLESDEYDSYVQEVYTQLPESTKEKMLEIAKENGLDQLPTYYTPFAVKDFISQKGYYNLNTEKMPDGEDFPVWFLNEAESGYCVHYATAATVMLRALGIPARYVTGYYVNAQDNNWTVVTSDNAHAWVEYYDSSVGWVVLEATPSSFEPVSNIRQDVETVPATEPEATSVDVPETVPIATQGVANNGGADAPTKTETKSNNIIFFVIILILIIAGAVAMRYVVIIKVRKRRFNNGKYNTRAIYIYRYIEKIKKLSHNVIPDKINEIANKAKFSNHRVSREEVDIMLSFSKEARDEFYRNVGKIKSLYYKIIKVI